MKTLHPHQELGILRFMRSQDKRLFYVVFPGGGKTAMAVESARRLGAKKVLVITLAVLRGQWVREFAQFWPEHPPIGVITAGKERKTQTKKQRAAYEAPYQIVSYALVKHTDLSGWDLIILDEVQKVAHSWTQQAREVRARVLDANPTVPVLALTGTPIPKYIPDLWHPVYIVAPRFWQKPNKNGRGSWLFNKRYSNEVPGPYGSKWEGVREEHLPELREKLARVMYIVKRSEVKGLPAITFSVLPVPVPRAIRLRSEADYQKLAFQKVEHILEWLDLHSEETHKALLVWFRDTAAALGHELRKAGVEHVYEVTGEVPPEKRLVIRDKFQETGGVLIFNMAAFGVGVNLGFVTRALFAEIYGRPETFVQAMMRFPRIDSEEPCIINALVAEGTADEFIAAKLTERVEDTNKVLGAGGVEDQLLAGFAAENEMSDDQFMQMALSMGVRDLDSDDE